MTDRICISGKVRNVNWTSLPVDIHDLILKSLAQHRRLASYATVCKEWQASIEKKNFDRLKLGQSCLDEFERIAKRKGKLIKHIWLNIELLQYTCQTCRLIETDRWTRKNNDIISESISRLFSILHTCMPTNNSGLTLELNAYSPSDQKHWFKGCYFGAHGEDEVLESDLQSQENGVARDDLAHDWRNGWELELTGLNDRAIQRPFEEIGLRFLGELPQVEAVTKFVLRRQCRRQWDPSTLKHLWEKLPRLEHIVYEPWQAWDETSQRAKFDRDYVKLMSGSLPTSLKSISVFEDFNDHYLRIIRRHQSNRFHAHHSVIRTPTPAIGAAFAAKSLELEHLSVAFMVEAEHFFAACRSQWNWNHLQCLALTSCLMTRGNCPKVINLLQNAGKAALLMPKLQTMALWNGAKREACAFQYRRKDGTITWRGTWDIRLELCGGVLDDWTKVGSRYAGRELLVKVELIQCEIRSHGDAIHHLNLPRVIDPVSMRQIQKEHLDMEI